MSRDFTITLDDEALLSAISGAIQQLEHPHLLMEAIGGALEANARLRFLTRTDPNGQPWEPRAKATEASYLSSFGFVPGDILNATNLMMSTLASNAGDDWVEVGTSRATAGGEWQIGMLHEFGTSRMPRRGILFGNPEAGTLGAQDQADVLELVQDALDGMFSGR